MNTIVLAVAGVTVIGIICAVILAIASKVMAVEEDERFPVLRECLPGANCGACGYAGCNEYTNALLSGAETQTNLCIPGGDSAARAISEFLGLAYQEVVEQVALPCCHGNSRATAEKLEYHGIQSCAAAKLFFGGTGQCTFGCMGLGDCLSACPHGAICIVNGLAFVDTRKCGGCGLCAKTCPNHLFQMMPDTARVVVHCKNTRKGAETKKACKNGCIGCRKCEKECPNDAIHVVNNLAQIDYDKCVNCGKCAEVCPSKCVSMGNFTGIHNIAI